MEEDNVHEEVRQAIGKHLCKLTAELEQLELDARYIRRCLGDVRAAVEHGRWWELLGTLTKAQIDMLYNEEITDRSWYLNG